MQYLMTSTTKKKKCDKRKICNPRQMTSELICPLLTIGDNWYQFETGQPGTNPYLQASLKQTLLIHVVPNV